MAKNGVDIIKALKDDHDTLRELFAKMEETTERGVKTRQTLLQKIAMELRSHAEAEDEVFYTRFRSAAEEKEQEEIYYEAKEEHHVVDLLLPELEALDPSTPEFTARATVLMEIVEHHAEEEEKEMFKEARSLLGVAERRTLGEQFLARKEQIKDSLAQASRRSPRPRAEQRA